MVQYAGVKTHPYICARVLLIAPGIDPVTGEEFKHLKKTIRHLHKIREVGFTYSPLDIASIRLLLLTDASVSNLRRFKSQLGYLLIIVDDDGRSNIIHHSSSRCRRVRQSVRA